MRVECRSNKDSFLIEYKNVTVGKIYSVTGLDKDYSLGTDVYTVTDDNGLNFTHGISIFRLIKEDKMENRIVRKLEDLDGLENGSGLKISIYGHPLMIKVYIPFEDNIVFNKLIKSCGIETIHQLKAMGFEFEYKPLRTEQEVKKEILSLESLPFTQEKVNYYVDYNNLIGKYLVICDSVNGHGLHIYMTEEQAQKYADELNEIIGVGK